MPSSQEASEPGVLCHIGHSPVPSRSRVLIVGVIFNSYSSLRLRNHSSFGEQPPPPISLHPTLSYSYHHIRLYNCLPSLHEPGMFFKSESPVFDVQSLTPDTAFEKTALRHKLLGGWIEARLSKQSIWMPHPSEPCQPPRLCILVLAPFGHTHSILENQRLTY